MSLDYYASRIHDVAVKHGFWGEDGMLDRNFGEMVALMHSELSEALEAHREGKGAIYYKNIRDERHLKTESLPAMEQVSNALIFAETGQHVTDADWREWAEQGRIDRKPEGVAVELIDTVIRVLDCLYFIQQNQPEPPEGGRKWTIDGLLMEKIQYNESRPHKHGKAY